MSGSAQAIKAYRQAIDDGEEVTLNKAASIHTVCGLLKLYIRELPDPLIPFSLVYVFTLLPPSPPPQHISLSLIQYITTQPQKTHSHSLTHTLTLTHT